jgi:hypothetical protein
LFYNAQFLVDPLLHNFRLCLAVVGSNFPFRISIKKVNKKQIY